LKACDIEEPMNIKSIRPFDRFPGNEPKPGSGERPRHKDKVAIGVPLAKLIKRELLKAPELVMLTEPRSVAAERYRRLKTSLTLKYPEDLQMVVVTSPLPSEGKTTVSFNLALALAADGSDRTLLVDGDLRRPSVGAKLKPAPQLGITEILKQQAGLEHALLGLENAQFDVLPAGSVADEPSELLSSDQARSLFAELRERYDRIIVDTPPIVPFTDADGIASFSDGALMVVRAGVTPVSSYEQAVTALTSSRVLGTVINDMTRNLADWDRYRDYHYYSEYYRRGRKE
jgi:capsular exopolysaccharide synthesis family protein